MKIRKAKDCHTAIIILGRKALWTSTITCDGRMLHDERARVRERAAAFCARHGLDGYTIYASAARGGYTVDSRDLRSF